LLTCTYNGSSPRVWGTLIVKAFWFSKSGFIPTGVGNTVFSLRSNLMCSVHPHGCGEHEQKRLGKARGSGSSPRVWGTLHCVAKRVWGARFIPTGVGNTSAVIWIRLISTVHPHGCGEHMALLIWTLLISGSSPRVWGTPCPWL